MKTVMLLISAALAVPASGQQLSFQAAQADPAAIRIMNIYARCVVADDPKRAASIVEADYGTSEYQAALRSFAIQERRCVPRAGKLRFQPIVFTGLMAEDLMRRRHVAVAALDQLRVPPEENGPFACVIKHQSAEVARLFDTLPASGEETQAIGALQKTEIGCLSSDQAPLMNKVVLRAQLALVSYRFAQYNRTL